MEIQRLLQRELQQPVVEGKVGEHSPEREGGSYRTP